MIRSNNNETVSDLTQSGQIIVPGNMRTRRQMSRYIALSAIALWLISYIVGVNTLAHETESRISPFDNFLITGSRDWAIRAKSSGVCIGFLTSQFVAEGKPILSLNGMLNLPLYGRATPVEVKFGAHFTSYYKLSELTANIATGPGSFVIESDKNDPAKLSLTVSAPSNLQRVSLRRPEPIYLVEQRQGQFSIRFPQTLNNVLVNDEDTTDRVSHLLGMTITPLSPEEASACKLSASAPQSLELNLSGILDIGTILDLIKTAPHGLPGGFGIRRNT